MRSSFSLGVVARGASNFPQDRSRVSRGEITRSGKEALSTLAEASVPSSNFGEDSRRLGKGCKNGDS